MEPQSRWNAPAAALAIAGANLKVAALAWRFMLDAAAVWLDAAHQVAELWRAPS